MSYNFDSVPATATANQGKSDKNSPSHELVLRLKTGELVGYLSLWADESKRSCNDLHVAITNTKDINLLLNHLELSVQEAGVRPERKKRTFSFE